MPPLAAPAARTESVSAAQLRVCPECSGPLARNSGCVTCIACGWGHCG
jgi:hypothetical protein